MGFWNTYLLVYMAGSGVVDPPDVEGNQWTVEGRLHYRAPANEPIEYTAPESKLHWT